MLLQRQFPSISYSMVQEASSNPTALDFSVPMALEATERYARDENLRLLYVALTRARLRTTVYVHARKKSRSKGDEEPLFMVPIDDAEQETSAWEPAPKGVGGLARDEAWPDA